MKNPGTSETASERPPEERARRPVSTRSEGETVEEAVARVRALPSFLEEIGPEALMEFQREAAKYPEVMGWLPPIKTRKRKR